MGGRTRVVSRTCTPRLSVGTARRLGTESGRPAQGADHTPSSSSFAFGGRDIAFVARQSRVATLGSFAMALPVIALTRVFLFVAPPTSEVPLFPAGELVFAFDPPPHEPTPLRRSSGSAPPCASARANGARTRAFAPGFHPSAAQAISPSPAAAPVGA